MRVSVGGSLASGGAKPSEPGVSIVLPDAALLDAGGVAIASKSALSVLTPPSPPPVSSELSEQAARHKRSERIVSHEREREETIEDTSRDVGGGTRVQIKL